MEVYLVALGALVLVPGLVSMGFRGFSRDPRKDKKHARISIYGRRAEDRVATA